MPRARAAAATEFEIQALEALEIEPARLFLDEKNPRLTSSDAKTQDEILKVLCEEISVDEVALSIAENGYFREEQLWVVPRSSKGPKNTWTYTVVEGNRRLAAVKVLLDPDLQRKLKVTGLPRLTSQVRRSIQALPVKVYESRDGLWTRLGFRHINGPKEWDAYAKAQFVASVNEKLRIPVEEIARRIRDRSTS